MQSTLYEACMHLVATRMRTLHCSCPLDLRYDSELLWYGHLYNKFTRTSSAALHDAHVS